MSAPGIAAPKPPVLENAFDRLLTMGLAMNILPDGHYAPEKDAEGKPIWQQIMFLRLNDIVVGSTRDRTRAMADLVEAAVRTGIEIGKRQATQQPQPAVNGSAHTAGA